MSGHSVSIYVQSQFVAQHRWREAPEAVAFLREWHRHIFKVRVDLRVTHPDRNLEFFMVQEDLNNVLKVWEGTKKSFSCEMYCLSIYDQLVLKYPSLFRVEVSEDGENGAVVKWEK